MLERKDLINESKEEHILSGDAYKLELLKQLDKADLDYLIECKFCHRHHNAGDVHRDDEFWVCPHCESDNEYEGDEDEN